MKEKKKMQAKGGHQEAGEKYEMLFFAFLLRKTQDSQICQFIKKKKSYLIT